MLENFYEKNVTWFTATRGTITAKQAFNIDKMYEAEPEKYPGRLENIRQAREMIPRVVALRLMYETQGDSALSKIAAFCQAWQEGTKGEKAAEQLGQGEEEREFGKRSYQSYLQGILWADKDFPNLGGIFYLTNPVSYSRTLSDLMIEVDKIVMGQFRKNPLVIEQIEKG